MNKFHRFLPLVTLLLTSVDLRAQVVTPNPAPTIITSAPYTISSPGYYQLGANLTVAATSGAIITINASNVTLDFGGHYISGPNGSNSLYGIYANEEGNLTIRNGTVADCLNGIYFGGNGQPTSLNINQRIDNMLVSYCGYNGIWLVYARNSEITNNRVSFIGSTQPSSIAIYGYGCTGFSILNNEVTAVTNAEGGGAYGVQVGNTDSTTVFIVGNRVSGCGIGISGGKCQNNLTGNCMTSYTGTSIAGGNY